MQKYKDFLGLGIAGNFALHLDQAGEAEDFKDIITDDEAAPKGMFPFYLPSQVKSAKDILSTYPLSSDTLRLPSVDVNVQAEPEVGLVCELIYKDNKLEKIIPKFFGAYNDCSIRVKGASKISDKKNWGSESKGISQNLISIDKFCEGSIMDEYSICSYLRRNGKFFAYGEDVDLNGYSYFYDKLLNWMINQINTQKEFGPLENLSEYIKECRYPSEAIISIGATRYTAYGEKTFLKKDDEVIIIVYDRRKNSSKNILTCLKNKSFDKNISVLTQKVI